MAKKKSTNSLWLPINQWNLNEVFTTESISPMSFYAVRDFGNPVNRNQETEDTNNLILYKTARLCEIQLKINKELVDTTLLSKIKEPAHKYTYPKTIYLRKGYFEVYFASNDIRENFIKNTFLLLEVKSIGKYKDCFLINEGQLKKGSPASYKHLLFFNKEERQPYFDKAFNQIKGLIYGYVIGSIGSLEDNEQDFVFDLTKLKNTIAGVYTDIALSEQYSNLWLITTKKQVKDCSKRYVDLIKQNSTVFDTLILRLEEVDNLNKMRCEELGKQKSPEYRKEYEQKQTELEKERRKLYVFESKHDITAYREELQQIKNREKANGESEGKKRKYFRKGSYEHTRKQELKEIIEEFGKRPEYDTIRTLEKELREYQFGGTEFDTSIFDTSINEQFSRISEQLNDLVKRSNSFFISKNNKQSESLDISFKIDINTLSKHYFDKNKNKDFSIQLPELLVNTISIEDVELLKISLNAVLSFPQGRLGNYSEETILKILIEIGKLLPDGDAKNTLRAYYNYRTKSDKFAFPQNDVLANLIVFFMKLQGHDQINKMLIAKGVQHKQIAFMLYGAYMGFANLPKTFTNIIFESGNEQLFTYIDDYLYNNYLNLRNNG